MNNNVTIIKKGNIFDSEKETVVNTINCKGVMGAGLAKQFKEQFPEMYKDYLKKYENKRLNTGEPYMWQGIDKKILNFPTKNDWKQPSKREYIISGLDFFINHYREWNIQSIAFPPLGCGQGKLPWLDVKNIMINKLSLIDIPVDIYYPHNLTPIEKGIDELLETNNVIKIIRSIDGSEFWTDWREAKTLHILQKNVDKEIIEIINKVNHKYNINIVLDLDKEEKI